MRILYVALVASVSSAFAQDAPPQSYTLTQDTIRLNEVVVRAYESNRPLLQTAASVGLLSRRELTERFGAPTLVPALNTLPGVRADERSPGSYRLSIRGSLIRSPFGVRNVKVYWNDLPLTDAGGNTPLNALDVRALGGAEVLKGPAGSLYGANTGGAVLFSGPATPPGVSSVEVNGLAGSYGLGGGGVAVTSGRENASLNLSYQNLGATGYRAHSALRRDNVQLTGQFRVSDRRTISVLGLFSDLNYQTPGGLTEAQYRLDPRQARPATRATPGSAEQQAAIYQKLGYLGLSQTYRFNERWQNTTALYATVTDFRNPFITNYERRADQGLGGRTVTRWQAVREGVPTVITFGAELGHNFTISRNYGNRRGQIDTLQTDDELKALQWLGFAQVESTLPAGFVLTAGISRNEVRYQFTRFSNSPANEQRRTFDPVWLPRVALLKQLTDAISVFGSISTGYSAPTLQEIRPSDLVFNPRLTPERGTSYELGLRGSTLAGRLQFDLAAYQFALRETIVRRTTDAGAETFTNAGRTEQRGLEALLSYQILKQSSLGNPVSLRIWNALTLTNYRYRDYRQGTADVSGKRVPGVAPTTNVSGLDLNTRFGLYAFLTYQFLSPFALNDANTATADPTRIATATVGFRRTLGPVMLDLFATGDNLLDQQYSLGYDLNAFGNRFYNASARRNFVGGVRASVRW
ncbi:TonB-dependent receptor [Rudanella paleaurantiibacter]|uniref:TonB-dependent receptor n=1 Tax=Rudanella paleaurantiibacter TaxID=2614655 RepID=A0A7J5U0U6_9BACT|nr:TonB-dependent receptor [Rudanella paleaurantiibacter]KAB7731383.1 TonB-dependent receptor [Rudanella paleaurantiibacter]